MRKTTAFVVVALVAAWVGVAPVLAQTDAATNETDTTAGQTLSGVVAAQHEDTRGDIDRKAFGIKLREADTQEEKAELIKQRQDELENRSERIRERAMSLNKNVSGQYIADAARVAQRSENVKAASAAAVNQSERLPRDVLERNGVNVTRLEMLRDKAGDLTGPEIARVAQGISGNGPSEVGPPERGGPPSQEGPPNDTGPPNNGPVDGDDGDDETTAGEPGTDSGNERPSDNSDQSDTPADDRDGSDNTTVNPRDTPEPKGSSGDKKGDSGGDERDPPENTGNGKP